MTVFVFGASGIIGGSVFQNLINASVDCIGIDHKNIDNIIPKERYEYVDCRNLEEIKRITQIILQRQHGQILNIINCAGIDAKPDQSAGTSHLIDDMLMVNQRWPVEFIGHLLKNIGTYKLNVILLDTTYTRLSPRPAHYKDGYVKPFPYIMSKAYTESFVKYLTVHYPRHRFNCVAPHLVVESENQLRADTHLLEQSVVDRACPPAEIASVICYLLDPLSYFVKGERIKVDGGWTA